jgi:hypothetical protein
LLINVVMAGEELVDDPANADADALLRQNPTE